MQPEDIKKNDTEKKKRVLWLTNVAYLIRLPGDERIQKVIVREVTRFYINIETEEGSFWESLEGLEQLEMIGGA